MKGNDVEKDLRKPELLVRENQTRIPEGIKQIQRNQPSHELLEEARKPVLDAISGAHVPDGKSTVSYFPEAHVSSLATSNPVLRNDLQCDHYLDEQFSFQRPTAAASGHNLISKEQAREPTLKQPISRDPLNPRKMPLTGLTGPLSRPNLSSTRCSEYKTDDRFPIEMQFGSSNDRRNTAPILMNAHVLDQVTPLNTEDEEVYRGTDQNSSFVARQMTSDDVGVDHMTRANNTEYNEMNKWPPLREPHNNRQNNREAEEATVDPFLLRRNPDVGLLQNEKSGFEASSSNSNSLTGQQLSLKALLVFNLTWVQRC